MTWSVPSRRCGVDWNWLGAHHDTALDNAVAEAFNSTLEFELLSTRDLFATREQARHAVAGWIDEYNTIRRHSTAQMMPPVAYELAQAQTAAQTVAQADAEDKAEGAAA